MTEAKVKKWGNSLALIIPKEVAKIEDIGEGDTVKIEVSKEKRIDGFGIWKGLNLPPFKRDLDGHDDLW
jgi:bifunctional DNA-binding transcriptional regulator/antitoxin component of YhaV-PrlF toxin-antitoxin module